MDLDLFYSEVKSPDEFKFDSLAPSRPLFSMVPVELDKYLYDIAINPRNSVKTKYELIDKAMCDYGFSKLARGTNRSVYQYLYSDDVIVKVGIDKYGVQDAKREYYNQSKLKPFCTKTFEVSPTGAIGLFEKVKPIIYKDEFRSIAEDVFDLLVKHVLGKYILADIGASFFMNYGLRRGFGPVLLDYPYMYELDGTKIHCKNRIKVGNQVVKCDGLIDYDTTFDFLVCEKCGKKYLASDIAKIGNDNVITLDPEMGGCIKMAGKMIIGGEIIFDTEGNGTDTRDPEILRLIEDNNLNTYHQSEPRKQQKKQQPKPDVSVFKNKESVIEYYKRQILKVSKDFLKNDMVDRYALTCMVYGILSFIKYTDKSINFTADLLDIVDEYVEVILDQFEREENMHKRPRDNNPRPKEEWTTDHHRSNNFKQNKNHRQNNHDQNRNQNQQQKPKSSPYIQKDDSYVKTSTTPPVLNNNQIHGEVYGDLPPLTQGVTQHSVYNNQPLDDIVLNDTDSDYQQDYQNQSEAIDAFNSIGESNISRLKDVASRIDDINNQGPEDQDPQKKNRRDFPEETKQEFSAKSSF